ncbi:MAG: hypothetical protein M1817_002549 [Caeruleum heppii]|nr:MAG: hypothetical protein M1817_002549 [Caeruleum heppii]
MSSVAAKDHRSGQTTTSQPLFPPSPPIESSHILIIGAGIVGLTLAQALRKHFPHVRCSVFERDEHPLARGAGWGLTLHWALESFLYLLPDHLVARLDETFVDPEASRAGDGNFTLFDLRTGHARLSVPPSKRIRVKRENLRRLLLEGIDVQVRSSSSRPLPAAPHVVSSRTRVEARLTCLVVNLQWSKNLTAIEVDDTNGDNPTASAVRARFDDDSSASGSLLIGCDGSHSAVRRLLCPATYKNTSLPVRLLGVSYACSAEKAQAVKALDPFFFQGSDPQTDAYLWFSFLDTPSSHPTRSDEYTYQVIISWPYRTGFNGRVEPTEMPSERLDRLRLMRSLAAGWVEPFRSIVLDIPDDADPKPISLDDWPPSQTWDNAGGRITLMGDAAHAMTMYRGEAANHGIADIRSLLDHLGAYLTSPTPRPAMLEGRMNAYETEMIGRTKPAVLRSRQACLDAHDTRRLGKESPLVSRRVVTAPPEKSGYPFWVKSVLGLVKRMVNYVY